jgi:hypothetical protein
MFFSLSSLPDSTFSGQGYLSLEGEKRSHLFFLACGFGKKGQKTDYHPLSYGEA